MILGVSVVLAVFAYFAYRHLYTYAADSTGSTTTIITTTNTATNTSSATSASSTASALSMWPFVSTILRSQSSLSKSASSDLKKIRRDGVPPCMVSEIQSPKSKEWSELIHLDNHTDRNDRPSPEPESPNATPKVKPVRPSPPASIPEISLLEVTEYVAPNDDDDLPPIFPAVNSAQRASAVPSSLAMPPPPSISSLSMQPPPIPNRNPRMQGIWNRPNPNSSAVAWSRNLAVAGAGASGVAARNGLTLPGRNNNKSRKSRVFLEPGHSPLDWARLQKSGLDLRGLPHSHLLKVPPSMLTEHKTAPDDVWMALNGKVYNVSAYIPFHPGGEKELMRAAGKDGTALFNKTHHWVNIDNMLEECLIGILVSEEELLPGNAESSLEQVD